MKNRMPAFPLLTDDGSHYAGMDLRDFFASSVLTGCEMTSEDDFGSSFWYSPEKLADRAYEIADAMMKRRQK
jgi:hypothetical protein